MEDEEAKEMNKSAPARIAGETRQNHVDMSVAMKNADSAAAAEASNLAIRAVEAALTKSPTAFTGHSTALLTRLNAEESSLHDAIAAIDGKIRGLTEAFEGEIQKLEGERQDALFAFSLINAARGAASRKEG